MIDKKKFAGCRLFDRLSPEELDKLISISREISYQPDKIIDVGEKIYIILSGRVTVDLKITRIRLYSHGDGKVPLTTLQAGDILGEVSFLGNKSSSARVTAMDEVNMLEIDNQDLEDLFERDNHLAYIVTRNLAFILSQRLLKSDARLRDKI